MTNQDKVFQILLAEDNPVDILMTKKALKELANKIRIACCREWQ